MKKLLGIIVLGLLCCNFSYAFEIQKWTEIASSDDGDLFFINDSSYRTENDSLFFKSLISWNKSQGQFGVLNQELLTRYSVKEVNCKEKKMRLIFLRYYDGRVGKDTLTNLYSFTDQFRAHAIPGTTVQKKYKWKNYKDKPTLIAAMFIDHACNNYDVGKSDSSYSSSFPDGMMNDKDVMKLIEEESLKIIEGQ